MPAPTISVAIAIKAALERGGIEPARVSEVIMGSDSYPRRRARNPARQASIAAVHPGGKPSMGR